MKALNRFTPEYGRDGDDFSILGMLVHEEDKSEPYEEDEAKLFKNQRRYSLIGASGCSCWDGGWEGWTDLTLTELRKLGKSWSNDSGASGELGKWIVENI